MRFDPNAFFGSGASPDEGDGKKSNDPGSSNDLSGKAFNSGSNVKIKPIDLRLKDSRPVEVIFRDFTSSQIRTILESLQILMGQDDVEILLRAVEGKVILSLPQAVDYELDEGSSDLEQIMEALQKADSDLYLTHEMQAQACLGDVNYSSEYVIRRGEGDVGSTVFYSLTDYPDPLEDTNLQQLEVRFRLSEKTNKPEVILEWNMMAMDSRTAEKHLALVQRILDDQREAKMLDHSPLPNNLTDFVVVDDDGLEQSLSQCLIEYDGALIRLAPRVKGIQSETPQAPDGAKNQSGTDTDEDGAFANAFESDQIDPNSEGGGLEGAFGAEEVETYSFAPEPGELLILKEVPAATLESILNLSEFPCSQELIEHCMQVMQEEGELNWNLVKELSHFGREILITKRTRLETQNDFSNVMSHERITSLTINDVGPFGLFTILFTHQGGQAGAPVLTHLSWDTTDSAVEDLPWREILNLCRPYYSDSD